MILKVKLPLELCVHDRPKVREYIQKRGIDVTKKVMLYRDITTGEYIVMQDTDLADKSTFFA